MFLVNQLVVKYFNFEKNFYEYINLLVNNYNSQKQQLLISTYGLCLPNPTAADKRIHSFKTQHII